MAVKVAMQLMMMVTTPLTSKFRLNKLLASFKPGGNADEFSAVALIYAAVMTGVMMISGSREQLQPLSG